MGGEQDIIDDRALMLSSWSTDQVAPSHRFALWATRPWPSIASVFDIEPIGPFETASEHVLLGELTLQFAGGTARHYGRSTAKIRVDGVDFLGVSVMLDGSIEGHAAAKSFRAGPGAIVFLDLAQQSDFTISTSSSIQIAVPRSLAERHLGMVAALHGGVIDADRAALLRDYLCRLREEMPRLTVTQGPGLARVILELLGVVQGHAEQVAPPPRPGVSSARLAAEAVIDDELTSSRLSAATICTRLEINRTALFRLFEVEGGFQAYARRLRLEHVRRAISDSGNHDSITMLAERWGFADGSHLSRLFRRQFGFTPTEYRRGQATPTPSSWNMRP